MSYLREFALLEWHIGHVAIAIDEQPVSVERLAAIPNDSLLDATLMLQSGLRYLQASWPVGELMELYLSETAPDRLEFEAADVCIEVRGARGEFNLKRFDQSEFVFRECIMKGDSIGAAAERLSILMPPLTPEGHWRCSLQAIWLRNNCEARVMIATAHALRSRFVAVREWLGRFPLSILQLGMRIGVGLVFFNAGILKINPFEFAVKLFQDEYKLPLIDPVVAARIATFNELTFSSLLFVGLASRLATLPLLGQILVIQIFVYPKAWNDHVLWGSILLFMLTRGLRGHLKTDHRGSPKTRPTRFGEKTPAAHPIPRSLR